MLPSEMPGELLFTPRQIGVGGGLSLVGLLVLSFLSRYA